MKILFPTDFSDNAKKAFEFTKELAKKLDASVTLLFSYATPYDFAARVAEFTSRMEEEAHYALEMMVKEHQSEQLKIDFVIRQGTVSQTICDFTLKNDFDLIVMGTQGASGIKKHLIGSNTAHVVKDSHIPVLVVPANAELENIHQISIAVELKKEDEAAIEKMMLLTGPFQLPYEIIHIESEYDFEKNLAFKGLGEYLKEKYPQREFTYSKLHSKEIQKGLEIYLNDNPLALLVTFSKHKSLFEYIFHTSQTVQLAYHTHVPMLVMK
jgi:nucleotide-binding universal stress UspA family protein